jgi:alkylation response protein AidB-like acyl-CoA dehydrogenase
MQGNSLVKGLENLQSACESIAGRAAETDASGKFPQENIKTLGDSGLLGMFVPKQHGGMEANSAEFARAAQKVGGACASTGMIFVMHNCAIYMMNKHWSDAAEILTAAAKGKHLSTLACSERGTGANFYASFSTSVQEGDKVVLDAQKCFVTSGRHADSYIVSAQAVGSSDAVNTSLYVIMKDDAGLNFDSVSMNLSKCRIADNRVLGKQGQGLELEMTGILPLFLLGSSAVYNGIAEAALNATTTHLKGRVHKHTGDALVMLPVLRGKVASMKIAVDASVALQSAAAEALDRGDTGALIMLLEAKQLACRTAVEVSTLAMECCGGIAFSGVLSVDRHFRDAQAGVVMAPSNDILLDLVGRAALDLPLM